MSEFNEVGNKKGKRELEEKFSLKKEIFEWLEVIVSAMILVVFLFTFVFRIATIDGPSMQNTLHSGEKVIISNIFYTPKAGDVVVISRNASNDSNDEDVSDKPIIKRIIATAGQTVDIDFEAGKVYVDGKALDEPYTKTPTNLKYDDGVVFPLVVSEGSVFVLGDNRNDSLDSRSARIGNCGMVDTRYILGRAVIRIYPFSKFGRLSNGK